MNRAEYFKAYYQENKSKILDKVRERNLIIRESQKIEKEDTNLFKKVKRPIIINFNM